jgi:hypothetical protein
MSIKKNQSNKHKGLTSISKATSIRYKIHHLDLLNKNSAGDDESVSEDFPR